MKLVENWKQAWRWFSVQAFGAVVALPLVWQALPPDVKAFLPDGWEPWVLVGIAAAGIIGRVIDQGGNAKAAP